jgi:transcriptional regulator with XRE-family HTH domain
MIQSYFVRGTQIKLARELGVSRRAVNKWMAAGVLPMYAAVAAELMLGVPADKLMSAEDAERFTAVIEQRIKADRSYQ